MCEQIADEAGLRGLLRVSAVKELRLKARNRRAYITKRVRAACKMLYPESAEVCLRASIGLLVCRVHLLLAFASFLNSVLCIPKDALFWTAASATRIADAFLCCSLLLRRDNK